MAVAGGMLLWLARATVTGRLKRNTWAGIRTPSTLASDEAWLVAHQRAQRSTIWAAVFAFIGCGFTLAPVQEEVVYAGVFGGTVALLATVLYGAYVGTKAARAIDSHDGASR